MEGTPFGRYQLLDLLGAGAMGEVHRAYDTGTDRLVAVKVLAREFAHDAVYRKRFQREAQVAARLAEPHIVPIHDFGEIDGRLYLDMRLVQAPNLAELLAERDRLEPGEAVEVIAQIAAALDAAHAEGLVHRDVKPSNILVTPKGFAYLIDFGIARSDEDTTVTTTGAVIGTFAYMAPERLADDESGTRSDVYSLACVLYECLVGAKPYRGESMQRQIAAHLNDEPPLPSTAGLPRPFDAVIAKGMAKYPGDRYETAGALAAAARAALWEPPTEASPVPAPVPAAPDPAIPDSVTGGPHTPPPGTPVIPAEPTPAAAATPAPSTTPDPDRIMFSDPTPVTVPEPAPVAAPTPRPPWRAIVVMSVLALAVAGTSALVLTQDDSTLVTESPGTAPPAVSSTIRKPAPSTPGSVPPGPPPALTPPVSVTESVPVPVPVTTVAPSVPAAEPAPPPMWTEPEPQPSAPPPPPPVTTTPPPPVTTTTAEPTETETTTPVTTTPETTTPETTVTTTEEEGEEVAEEGSPDATGSTIATSSAIEPTDGTATSPTTGSATETAASPSTGTAADTTSSSATGTTEGTTTPPANGTGQGPASASSTDGVTATPSPAADPG